MTDSVRDPSIEVVEQDDDMTAALDRQADAFLEANEGRRPTVSIGESVRQDLEILRQNARSRSGEAREQIVAHPQKSVLYALGVGVLLGLILAR